MSFSNQIKTVLKLDDKDWKKALSSIGQAEKSYYTESQKNTEKLIQSKEDLLSLEKTKSKQIESINKDIAKSEKNLLLAREKNNAELTKSFTKRLKLQNQTKKSINANAKVEIDTTKHTIKEINNKIHAQEKYNAILKKAKTNFSGQASGIDSVSTINARAKATDSYTNSIVRHLRQIETLVVAYYTLSTGFKATVGVGIEVNKIIESNTHGIAAIAAANTRMIDSQGKLLTAGEKFAMGQKVAAKTLEELRIASVKTAATFPQLIEIYQQAVGQTMSMGGAFGETVDSVKSNTIQLSKTLSNLANSIGMPMDRVREEIRSMLSGNASTDSLISTMLFGSPGDANKAIKKAKDNANGVSDLLFEMMKDFKVLEGVRTYEKGFLNMQDSWSRAMGDMVKKSGAFQDITDMFYDMSTSIKENTEDIISTFDTVYNSGKETADVMGNLLIPAAGIASFYALSKAVGALTIAMKANPYLWFGAAAFTGASYLAEYFETIKEQTVTVNEAIANSTKSLNDKSISELKTYSKSLTTEYEKLKKEILDLEDDTSHQNKGFLNIFAESDEEHQKEIKLLKEKQDRLKVIAASYGKITDQQKKIQEVNSKIAKATQVDKDSAKLLLNIGFDKNIAKYIEKNKEAESSITLLKAELDGLNKTIIKQSENIAKLDPKETSIIATQTKAQLDLIEIQTYKKEQLLELTQKQVNEEFKNKELLLYKKMN